METEALIWALGVPQASIWGDRREEERAQELRKGWGWKASPRFPAPQAGAPRQPAWPLVSRPHPEVWLHCGWTPEARRPEACDWV